MGCSSIYRGTEELLVPEVHRWVDHRSILPTLMWISHIAPLLDFRDWNDVTSEPFLHLSMCLMWSKCLYQDNLLEAAAPYEWNTFFLRTYSLPKRKPKKNDNQDILSSFIFLLSTGTTRLLRLPPANDGWHPQRHNWAAGEGVRSTPRHLPGQSSSFQRRNGICRMGLRTRRCHAQYLTSDSLKADKANTRPDSFSLFQRMVVVESANK